MTDPDLTRGREDALIGWMRYRVGESNPVLFNVTDAAVLLDALDAARAKSMEWAERAGEWAGARDGALWDLDAARAENARLTTELAELRELCAAQEGMAAVMQAERGALRAELAGLRARVVALSYASDDGTEHEHNGHDSWQGEPECPGCWATAIRALAGEPA